MRWARRSSARRPEPVALQARRELPHPRPPGRRDGRAGGARRGRGRARMDPQRQGADHPRADDLSLSRPFDVRPGQLPDARGGAGLSRAQATRSTMPPGTSRSWASTKRSSRRSTRRSRTSSSRLPSLLKKRRSRTRPSSTPTCWWRAIDADRAQDARAVPDDGGGDAGQMAGQGRRRRSSRATSSPRSRPTRRRWSSRRSTRARSPRSWSPRAPTG